MASSGLYYQLKFVHSFWGLLFFTFILGTIALRLSNHSYLTGLATHDRWHVWRHMTDGIFKRVFLSLNIYIIHHQNELFVVGRHQIGNKPLYMYIYDKPMFTTITDAFNNASFKGIVRTCEPSLMFNYYLSRLWDKGYGGALLSGIASFDC